MTEPELQIPAGGRLVHIGFDKTGTTSLQGACAAARAELPAHGVVYPGTERYHKRAGVAITAAGGNRGDRPATMADWEELVGDVAAAGEQRVLISSEWLCRATDEQAAAVVHGLGGSRVHVVATLRPLVRILPSAWQQYVKDGYCGDYESWLRGMLLEPPYEQPTPWFWRRHSHDVVLARWAGLVGAANVTAIVVDEIDRELLLRQFEGLLGLPDGVLQAEPAARENRSLSWPEVELLRMVNQVFHDRGWSAEFYGIVVRRNLLPRLAAERDAAALPPIVTPVWALDRAQQVGAAAAEAINRLGVRVLGDLDSLGRGAGEPTGEAPAPGLPPGVAAEAVNAVVAGARRAARRGVSAFAAERASAPALPQPPEFDPAAR